jgi:alpha-glucosidase (family GH31 glycosyl hydrolase)
VYETSDIIRIKLTDANNARWEVPQSLLERPQTQSRPEDALKYKFSYVASPFSFEIIRLSDGRSLFSSTSLTFKDQFIQLSTSGDAEAVTFGIGESTRQELALKKGSKHTLWAADIAAFTEYVNLYGSFPFYMQMVNGVAHGAMLMSSNGMDVSLGSDGEVTFSSIGGLVDLYVFSGSTPANVVDQYTQIVGRPGMMPYWSLGFHNCKYGTNFGCCYIFEMLLN